MYMFSTCSSWHKKSFIVFIFSGVADMDDISITESIAEENDAHAEPLHVQRVEQALSLSPLLRFIEHVISSPRDR